MGAHPLETRPHLLLGVGMPAQVAVSAAVDDTNCLQWTVESSGSVFLFLSPESHPPKQLY